MKPVNVLSGGEATRVELARIFTQPANVLILDEPTNFIDLPTITVLEQLIRSYRGMVCSHRTIKRLSMPSRMMCIKSIMEN